MKAIYDIADDIFDSGDIYFWTQIGNIVYNCKPIGRGPMLTQ